MKISDVAAGKVALESLADKKKLIKNSNAVKSLENHIPAKDVFDTDRVKNADTFKIKDLQKNYQKNSITLNGLSSLQSKVQEFENTVSNNSNQKNFDQLSSELKNIVLSTKFEGESVISYLSTNIKDDKSLYTLKANLGNEIDGVKSKLSEERKNIASFLVKNENQEVASAFSSEKTLGRVVAALDKDNLSKVYKNISNITTLLGIEK